MEAVRAVFGTVRGHDYPPRYDIAPTEPVGIVRIGADGRREFVLVRWGLIPGWVKDPREFATLINARAETLLEKPSFKSAIRHRRCIVPVDWFYEWTGKKGARQPLRIRAADPDAAPLALAGLWEHWLGADGSEIETMAIVTVQSNATLKVVHERMPAVLARADADAWLDMHIVKENEATRLLRPAPETWLVVEPIGTRIGASRGEGPDLIEAPPSTPDQRPNRGSK